jgi:hypothetical protein
MRWNEIILESGPRPMRNYLEANCLAMGMVIQDLLGWDLEMLYFGSFPFHVVARNPNGHYADVRGPNLTADQVLQGMRSPVPSWEPVFRRTTAQKASELFDKNPSEALRAKAREDLIHYWGADLLASLGARLD